MPSETFLLDTFAVTARDIADADVNLLLALSVGVGWSHRAEDWEFMREVGRGLVAMDEGGRVHGVAMWFPFGEKCATIGMLITTPRLQAHGGAQWLMRHVLEETNGRALGLHATSESHRLFLSLGFKDEGLIYRREGHVGDLPKMPPTGDAELREFSHSDLSAIRKLDRTATGWDRPALIDALVARSRGMVLSRSGKVEAVALMRPFGRGMVVGPIIAGSEEDALRVLHPLVAAQNGRFLRIDLWDDKSRLAAFAERCGLSVAETGTRMSLGKPWPVSTGAVPSLFAPASQATG
ncbi:MAG TPA: GNAT family N-acetyltransferase [Bryobacteraceae bacterium]